MVDKEQGWYFKHVITQRNESIHKSIYVDLPVFTIIDSGGISPNIKQLTSFVMQWS